MLDPTQYREVFGKTWVDRQEEPLLTIGGKSWTRYQLVSKIGVGNYKAVAILMDALQRLGVTDLKKAMKLEPSALAAIKGVGPTTLFVLMSLLQSEGTDPKEWYAEKRTFQSVKNAAEREKAAARTEAKRAAHRRRSLNSPLRLAK